MTVDELLLRLTGSDFRDPLGHPLNNCAEFVELQRRMSVAVKEVSYA